MSESELARHDERILAIRERVTALDQLIVRELDGFPQTYAKSSELQALGDVVSQIRIDHVNRNDWDFLRERVVSTEARLFRLYGGLMVVAAIGVANLIKIFAT